MSATPPQMNKIGKEKEQQKRWNKADNTSI